MTTTYYLPLKAEWLLRDVGFVGENSVMSGKEGARIKIKQKKRIGEVEVIEAQGLGEASARIRTSFHLLKNLGLSGGLDDEAKEWTCLDRERRVCGPYSLLELMRWRKQPNQIPALLMIRNKSTELWMNYTHLMDVCEHIRDFHREQSASATTGEGQHAAEDARMATPGYQEVRSQSIMEMESTAAVRQEMGRPKLQLSTDHGLGSTSVIVSTTSSMRATSPSVGMYASMPSVPPTSVPFPGPRPGMPVMMYPPVFTPSAASVVPSMVLMQSPTVHSSLLGVQSHPQPNLPSSSHSVQSTVELPVPVTSPQGTTGQQVTSGQSTVGSQIQLLASSLMPQTQAIQSVNVAASALTNPGSCRSDQPMDMQRIQAPFQSELAAQGHIVAGTQPVPLTPQPAASIQSPGQRTFPFSQDTDLLSIAYRLAKFPDTPPGLQQQETCHPVPPLFLNEVIITVPTVAPQGTSQTRTHPSENQLHYHQSNRSPPRRGLSGRGRQFQDPWSQRRGAVQSRCQSYTSNRYPPRASTMSGRGWGQQSSMGRGHSQESAFRFREAGNRHQRDRSPALDVNVRHLLHQLERAPPGIGEEHVWKDLIDRCLHTLADACSNTIEYIFSRHFGRIWVQVISVAPPWKGADIPCVISKHWTPIFRPLFPAALLDTAQHYLLCLRPNQSGTPSAKNALTLISLTKHMLGFVKLKPLEGTAAMDLGIVGDNLISYEDAQRSLQQGKQTIEHLFDECCSVVRQLPIGEQPQPRERSRWPISGTGPQPSISSRSQTQVHPSAPSRPSAPIVQSSTARSDVMSPAADVVWIRNIVSKIHARSNKAHDLLRFVKTVIEELTVNAQRMASMIRGDPRKTAGLRQVINRLLTILHTLYEMIGQEGDSWEAASKAVLTAMKDFITLVRVDAYRYCKMLQMPERSYLTDFKNKLDGGGEDTLTNVYAYLLQQHNTLEGILAN